MFGEFRIKEVREIRTDRLEGVYKKPQQRQPQKGGSRVLTPDFGAISGSTLGAIKTRSLESFYED